MNKPGGYDEDAYEQEDPEDLAELTDLLEQVNRATEEGRSDDALDLMAGLMAIMAERAENQVPSLHLAIRYEAEEKEAAADWAGAEAAYRRALEIAGDNPHWAYKGHDELRRLYMFLGRTQEALEEARAAVAAGSQSMELLHAHALVAQAQVHLDLGQAREARDLATEALPLYGTWALSDWQRAGALAVRARSDVELEDETTARDDLDESWRLLESQTAMAGLPGVQGAFGQWWQAEAALRRRTGDRSGCVKAWREVVLSRRWNAAQPQIAGPYVQSHLADALVHLARAQELAGDQAAATECVAESRSIRQDVEHPEPPDA